MSERYFRISDTPLPVLSERDQRRLLSVAEWAESWFSNRLAGNALSSPNDDIFIARELHAQHPYKQQWDELHCGD